MPLPASVSGVGVGEAAFYVSRFSALPLSGCLEDVLQFFLTSVFLFILYTNHAGALFFLGV